MLTDAQRQSLEDFTKTQIADAWSDISSGIPSAIDDIRAKVVEEGWFGRETSEQMADIKDALGANQSHTKDMEKSSDWGQMLEGVYGADREIDALDVASDGIENVDQGMEPEPSGMER